MFPFIQSYCDHLSKEFDLIPKERKKLLEKITYYISQKNQLNEPVQLVYICTHNSRRSHFGQVWAQVAAHYYKVTRVTAYSGGTEATAFNINAIDALKRAGFEITPISVEKNSTYHVSFAENTEPILCYSKVYNDSENPQKEFAAIMTCSEAEENCPFIPGAELRVGTTYEDPKRFDNTPLQDAAYDERCRQIALETLYIFSKLN